MTANISWLLCISVFERLLPAFSDHWEILPITISRNTRLYRTTMAPIPNVDVPSTEYQLSTPATQYDLQHAAASLSSSLRVIIMILAGLTLATGALYCLLRKQKARRRQLVVPGTPLLVYESTVSIEFDECEDDEGTIVDEYEYEYEGRASSETILSMGTPRMLAFDINKIMPFLGRRKGSILDRRGKTTMRCDTTAYYETDIIPTVAKSPIDRNICRPKVGFVESIVSPLSPFWSKQTSKNSPCRVKFGFNSNTITPPLGSPLWSRKNGL